MLDGIKGYHVNQWVNTSPTTPLLGLCTLWEILPNDSAQWVIWFTAGGIEFFLLDFTTKNLQNIFRGENTSYWRKNVVGFDALWSKLLR